MDWPFTLDEDPAAAASYLEMEHRIENTGGCGRQFQGKANVGNISRALHARSYADSVVGVAIGIGDSLGFLPKKNAKECLDYGRIAEQGTWPFVFYLAQHHTKPEGDFESATDFWSPRRFFYGFYPGGLWARSPLHFKTSTPKVKHALHHPE
jgi:hypothetical protein